MLKYVLLCVITVMVYIREVRPYNPENSRSFCNADRPVEIDDSNVGNGKIQYATTPTPKSWIIKLNREEDDGIHLEVSSFDLERSFLVIRDDSGNDGTIQFISGKSTKSLNFCIPYSKSFYMEICPEENQMEVNGAFTLTYERSVPDYGEGPLPGEPPEIEKEKQAVEVQFKGKTSEEFMNAFYILSFKEAVKSIARDFCHSEKIQFDESKSADEMVTIHNIHKCPVEWSDRHICVSVHHSVFVSGDDGNEFGSRIWEYQLIRKNLEKMWGTAKNNHLKDIGLAIYEPPDRTVVIGKWFSIVVLPFVIIIVLWYLLWRLYKYILEDKQNSISNSFEAADVETRRKSKLKPNKYQELPSYLKEEQIISDDRSKRCRRVQTLHKSYSAALLFSRLRMDGIPE